MENNNINITERQAGINRAFGRMYFAIYSIDVPSGRYTEISTLDIFREYIPPQGENSHLFDMVVKHYVSNGYKNSMRSFLDLGTLQERLKEQNAVSNEFFGTTQGWCRASFVVEKRDDDGNVLRFVYVTQEINEEVKSEQQHIAELKKAYEAADAANRAKTDFLFRMSHDIRTPLNAIMGFAHLIDSEADEREKVKEYASKIRVSGNLLLLLLNEILDMTKIESGNSVLNTVEFRLDKLIEELCTVIRFRAEEKEQVFTVSCEYENNDFIGDRVRITRVLFNILGNAVKYTAIGGNIIFNIKENAVSDDRSELVFTIEDNGIGMTRDLKNHVFEEFIRGSESEVTKTPGSGLGLPIAKSFTEIMGGEISVESESGKGSRFTVKLPLSRNLSPSGKTMAVRSDASDVEDVLSGLNVLIVEDNELNIEMITDILSIIGVNCVAALSGRRALEILSESAENAYDLIIMDVSMPEMDGYETTRRIRQMDRADAKSVPIVALTANAFCEDVHNAIKAGMNAHMAKPLDLNVLRDTVKKLL